MSVLLGFEPSLMRQKIAGVIGHPISHSLSPFIHQFWLNQAQTQGTYQAFGPQTEDEFKSLIHNARYENWAGFNITSPYKGLAFSMADYHSQSALKSQSANLFCFDKDQKIWAHSTDGYGMNKAFETVIDGFSFAQKKVAILGAGGAAQAAISHILDQDVAEIGLINRSYERLRQAQKKEPMLRIYSFENYHFALKNADIVISCLPVEKDWDLSGLSPKAVILDMTYRPLKTTLLKKAEDYGFQIVDGLWMLIHQARPSFSALFGLEEPDAFMVREALMSQLDAEFKT